MAYLGQSLTEGTRRVYTYTATASQTTFSAVYGVGAVDVYQNGVLLAPTDYTATNGTTVALTVGAAVNDEITIICHNTFSVADTVSASQGGTFNGDISLGDNTKAKFGASDDLQIYHDGSNSFIKDAGTGYLVIQANAVGFANGSNSENLAFFQQDGAATLHYDGVGKINTAAYGVDINGTVNSTGRFLSDTVGAGGGVTSGYQFGGDGNTGMYQDAYDQIQFSTAGSERMRIDSIGNVGIGTTSPSTSLHISKAGNGIVTVERSNKTSGSGYLGFNVEANSQATIAFDDGGGLSIGRSVDPSIQSGYTNDFVINSNGYVGIGTFTPGRILDINGAGSGNVVGIKGGANNQVNIAHGSNSSWGLLLGNSDSSVNIGYHYSTSGANLSTAVINVNNDALHLGTNNNQVMTLNHSGNVSIGVNTTSYGKLDVYREPSVGWTRSITRNAGRAAFVGVYKTTSPSTTNSAGIFAHDATLSAWDNLWINAHDNGSGGVAGGTNQNIYMAGKVHKPQQPYFRVGRSTSVSGIQTVTFDTVYNNIGNHYSTSNGRFTAPVAGVYYFAWQGISASSTTSNEQNVNIAVNGSGIHDSRFRGYTESGGHVITVVYLSAGDYASVIIGNPGTSLYPSAFHNQFMGYFLG